MRALRVVGLGEDGRTVILEDPMRGERFQLPADERLRAAARGDVTRLGQIEIELESQMRPREIQARIRAGENVAQVAEASGLPEDKVERFAYPVLLERSRTADLAQRAHPVREDGPDVQTLGEICAHAFGLRGQEYSEGVWDSWKNEENKWVVQLRWTAGRSDNHAHWSFHPGAHGGTVTPLDDHAHDLLDPNPSRSLRTVRPVTELARQALAVEAPQRPQPAQEPAHAEPAPEPVPQAQPEPVYQQPEPAAAHVAQPVYQQPEPERAQPETQSPQPQAEPAAQQPPAPEPQPVVEPAPAAQPEPAPAAATKPVQEELVPEPEAKPDAAKDKPAPRRGKKKNHPVVPAWEDVLLGVRSNRG
ncbi:septation protein SepH [Kibdelosporangium phytohabitans]|uniref:DNA-binding protein n=1 Tax=Kibdelosporangium phytohabitans TaxID=860235 RepID=A0A0N9HNT5_9PSEU|nr:septation protein SepH [Kibdelosporangium phytohabitans]ALG06056.1 DNA-binding protein [Kibdelosporangium phytohabitans]